MIKTQKNRYYWVLVVILLVSCAGVIFYWNQKKSPVPTMVQDLAQEELELRDTLYYKTCFSQVELMGGGVKKKILAYREDHKLADTLPLDTDPSLLRRKNNKGEWSTRSFFVKGFEPYVLLLQSLFLSPKTDQATDELLALLGVSDFSSPLFHYLISDIVLEEEKEKVKTYRKKFIHPEKYTREEQALRLFFEAHANLVLLQIAQSKALSFIEKEQYRKEYIEVLGFQNEQEMETLIGKAIFGEGVAKRVLLPYDALSHEQYLAEFQLPLVKHVLSLMEKKGDTFSDSLYVHELLWKNSPFRDNSPNYFPRMYRIMEHCSYPLVDAEKYMQVWWSYWVDFMLAELTPMQKDGKWKNAELTKALYDWMTVDLLDEYKTTPTYKAKYAEVEQFFGSFAALEEAAKAIQYGDPRTDWFDKKLLTQ